MLIRYRLLPRDSIVLLIAAFHGKFRLVEITQAVGGSRQINMLSVRKMEARGYLKSSVPEGAKRKVYTITQEGIETVSQLTYAKPETVDDASQCEAQASQQG